MKPEELSRQLREESGDFLAKRRATVALSLGAAASMGIISLYQFGIIKHLPDPPLPFFNSEKVDASSEAYALLLTPDGFIGLASYALTAGLAAMGGQDRADKMAWVPLALAAKVGFDFVNAARLTWDQWHKHRAFCLYCLVASGATFATVPQVLPEAAFAFKKLTGSKTK